MLNLANSRQVSSVSRKTAPATRIFAEGLALVADTSIDQGVAISSGAAGEQFVGLSISSQLDPKELPTYESKVVAAGAVSATLDNAPIAGTISVRNLTTGVTLTAAAPGTAQGSLTASQFAQTATGSRDIVVPAAMAGNELVAGYRFAPTLADIQWLQGEQLPGYHIANGLNIVGVITSGDLYTTEFDTASDWTSASLYVKLGANGKFVATATAADAIPGVRVLSRPGYNNAQLGLSIGLNG